MSSIKIAAIILILISGLVSSYFIVKNSSPEVQKNESLTEVKKIIGKAVSQNPIQWLKDLASSNNQGLAGLENLIKSSGGESVNYRQANLTEFVAKSMFNRMKEMDQNSDNPFENFDPNNKESQKMIQEALAGIQDPSLIFNVSVNEKDLKISQDNSSVNKARYLEEAGNIILKNLKENEFYKNPIGTVEKTVMFGDFSGLQKLINTYSSLFNEFMNLSVPSDWLDLHKRYLTLMRKAELIYGGVADIQSDPVKASLFIQLVPEIIDEEIAIKKEYQRLANSSF